MKVYALRLKPGQDVRKGLYQFAVDNNLGAGFILTDVGSLKEACLRMADT